MPRTLDIIRLIELFQNMTIVLAIIAIILSLILVVGMHEAGHALVAKYFGVKIERISIGFGKPLYTWTRKNGIEWVWARWPLGGYVKLLSHRIEPVAIQDFPFCFDKKPVYARILILSAGAFANLLVAYCAFTLMFMIGYKEVPAIVHQVTPKSIAATAGLKPGDKVIALANQTTPAWREVGMELLTHLGQAAAPITIANQAGIQRQTTLDLSHWHYKREKDALLKSLGITLDIEKMKEAYVLGVPFLKASTLAYHKIKYLTAFFFMMLKQVFTGQLPLAILLGPLGLFTAMAGSFLQGLSMFAYFIGTLSLAVAIVNLLPVPGLDGGSIAYAIVEKIRGKPLSVAFEVLLHQLAFIAFCVLLAQLIINDLSRFLGLL
ncbi:MAG: site-2 protease family protein [Legionellaceae bacterium]|nr:site-2 protease family protein [Legionellaceae bacterium]